MVSPAQKCRSAAGVNGAQAGTMGMPARLLTAARWNFGNRGVQRLREGARYLAVVTKTSASASALGRGFSKAKRIFMGDHTERPAGKGRGGQR